MGATLLRQKGAHLLTPLSVAMEPSLGVGAVHPHTEVVPGGENHTLLKVMLAPGLFVVPLG